MNTEPTTTKSHGLVADTQLVRQLLAGNCPPLRRVQQLWQVGDVLWIKEAIRHKPLNVNYWYVADQSPVGFDRLTRLCDEGLRHVTAARCPEWCSRLRIQITSMEREQWKEPSWKRPALVWKYDYQILTK